MAGCNARLIKNMYMPVIKYKAVRVARGIACSSAVLCKAVMYIFRVGGSVVYGASSR